MLRVNLLAPPIRVENSSCIIFRYKYDLPYVKLSVVADKYQTDIKLGSLMIWEQARAPIPRGDYRVKFTAIGHFQAKIMIDDVSLIDEACEEDIGNSRS